MNTTMKRTEVPIEVCEIIFDYIEEPSSLLSCAAVCKLWTKTCRIRFLARSDHFLRVPRGKHWEFVDIITSPYNTFLPVLIKLQYEHNSLFPNIFPHLPPLPNLKTLRLIGGDGKPIFHSDGGPFTLKSIRSQFNSLASITHLEIMDIHQYLNNEVFDIVTLFPNVSNLKLQSKKMIGLMPVETKEDEEPILTPITSLTIEDCPWSAYCLFGFFGSTPYKFQLREFHWRVPMESPVSIRKLINHFSPWLEILTLYLPTNDREIVNLRQCTRMTSVELFSTVFHTGYAATVRTLPKSIQRLKIVIEHPEPYDLPAQRPLDFLAQELADLVQRTPQIERVHIHIHFKRYGFKSGDLPLHQDVVECFERKLRPHIPDHLLSFTTERLE